ncbi:MAG: pyridoxal-phosphate dependent enzyme [Candidatus Lokiarchaeota archaeon]|nr:pyridoxal-phosphate dependent enzyme [Candidatus Lokiarchaeota archaeon]
MKNENKQEKELPYIMQQYPGLQKIPWISLIDAPTPVHRLNGLEKKLDFYGIYIKRDDKSNPEYGGNKPRKFEFLLGYALKNKKKHILTMGGIGSNHCVANSMFCKQLGLKSVVFLQNQPLTEHVRHNLLLELYYDAKIIHKKTQIGLAMAMIWYMITHWRSYLIWAGGSNKIGTIGFVNGAFELKHQIDEGILPEPDYIFTTTGSSGTTAGLLLGCELAGLKSKIIGVTVSSKQFASRKRAIVLAKKCYQYLREYDSTIPIISENSLEQRLEINTNYFGGTYGIVTDKGKYAVDLIKEIDNMELETTYTGKTLSAMIDFIKKYRETLHNETLLFWNTYSSVDQSEKIKKMDFHNLNHNLHMYFNGSVPLSKKVVKIEKMYD